MLNQRKAYAYFLQRFIMKKSNKGWWTFDNPFDPTGEGKGKMAVNFNYEFVKCWKTEWRGSLLDFVMEYEGLGWFEAKEVINQQRDSGISFEDFRSVAVNKELIIELPKGFVPIAEGKGILAKRAKDYLYKRGFDLRELDRLGFGYCSERDVENKKMDFYGYIIIPFRRMGRLIYYIGRDFTGQFLRYKNPPQEIFGIGKSELIFNEDALELCTKVYIVEGWSDAMTIGRAGTATLGWSLSTVQKMKYLRSDVKKFVFIPDAPKRDEDGKVEGLYPYKQAAKVALDFIDEKEVRVLDIEEFSDYGKDVNEVGKQRILELEERTVPMTRKRAMQIIMA